MSLNLKYNHNSSSFSEALGFSHKDYISSKHAIVYETLLCYKRSKDLYDKFSEAPKEISSCSAVLQNSLSHLPEDKQVLVFLNFQFLHGDTVERLSQYEIYSHIKGSKVSDKIRKDILSENAKVCKTLLKILNSSKDFSEFSLALTEIQD